MLHSLGYARFAISDASRWRHFAFDTMGFAEGTGPNPDSIYLRVDEHAARIELVPQDRDAVLAIGWQVADSWEFDCAAHTLMAAGVEITAFTRAQADERQVEAAFSVEDPNGYTLEIFHGPLLDHSPVLTRHGARFVTGELGLGHVVLPGQHLEEALHFYTEHLRFTARGSFRPIRSANPELFVRFLGLNARHHSLALNPLPPEALAFAHLMVEVDQLDDVGRALDRATAAGLQITTSLGRHTNDGMISFYVRTPSGWDLEFGCGGIHVGDTFAAEEMTADSYWGHHRDPAAFALP